MSYYRRNGQMDLTDRLAIETGLCRGESFKEIAKLIQRHPSTVAYEVQTNRTYIHSSYRSGKDCKLATNCHRKSMCSNLKPDCRISCKLCMLFDCRTVCDKYISIGCHKPEQPPYVCNSCRKRRSCLSTRYIYSAQYADEAVRRRRSESRQGIRLTNEQKAYVDELVTRLVKKGQPLSHIYAEHEAEMPMSLRSLYNYIDAGVLSIKNIDLRRKVGYRLRKKKKGSDESSQGNVTQSYREGRTFDDYEKFMEHSHLNVVEMDTVVGYRGLGKRILTMIFQKNSVMLMFLLPDGTAASVKRIFDYLEGSLGVERFKRLFPVFLTDNGSEFKRVDDLELTEDYEYRTRVFYCDPMSSWQKAHIEKNHEYIRYVLPKGKSFNPYTQEEITLLMNHINSTRRHSLGDISPYELVGEKDEDMQALFSLLKMDLIPPDEVHLKPDLFVKNR